MIKSNKKGFEVQFNWIFVLVAGAAILLFFTAIVLKQKSTAEISTKANILKSIESIIIGASVSTSTINIIDIPKSDIEVSCNKASLGKVSKQYQNLILFAPSLIKGNKLVTQTLPFNIPYRAVNLLYMTSPQVRYIIIGDTELAKEINMSLPSSLKKEVYCSTCGNSYEPSKIKDLNNYKVRFIVFGPISNVPLPADLGKMRDSDVTALSIDEDSNNITFYQRSGIGWLLQPESSTYIEKSSIIGAIYSDTLEAYECSMQNAFNRLNLVTKIYIDRTGSLTQGLGTQNPCHISYTTAENNLARISDQSLKKFTDLTDVESMKSAAKSLSNENKNLQLYSCPLVY